MWKNLEIKGVDHIPFSKNYIAMCKAATEIQELKFYKESEDFRHYKYDSGDYLCHISDLNINKCPDYIYNVYHTRERLVYWIPTFEQLLEIYHVKHGTVYKVGPFIWLCKWLENKWIDETFLETYQTKEEVGILWIYELCYNKKWELDKWI